eukprot:151325-Chlamydomonas_euryale.AAC.25
MHVDWRRLTRGGATAGRRAAGLCLGASRRAVPLSKTGSEGGPERALEEWQIDGCCGRLAAEVAAAIAKE